MSDYKRITMREFAGVTGDNIYNRLAELEDKIERGELISTVQSEQGEQEIAFFVKHNAEVRKDAVKECLRILRAIKSQLPRHFGTFWAGWSGAINAAIREISETYGVSVEAEE